MQYQTNKLQKSPFLPHLRLKKTFVNTIPFASEIESASEILSVSVWTQWDLRYLANENWTEHMESVLANRWNLILDICHIQASMMQSISENRWHKACRTICLPARPWAIRAMDFPPNRLGMSQFFSDSRKCVMASTGGRWAVKKRRKLILVSYEIWQTG